MNYLKRGALIAIEGIDGSGKSSLIKHLNAKLSQEALAIKLTREPGGSDIGKEIRKLLQEQPVKPTPQAEYLLFAADRSQHFSTVILPHLEKNYLVISDRLGDSSVAYQGYGRGLDVEVIQTINNWAMSGRQPDLILYLRLTPKTAFERIAQRNEKLTRFEQEKISFFEQVYNGYEALFNNRDNVITIDATQTQELVAQEGLKQVRTWLKKNNFV